MHYADDTGAAGRHHPEKTEDEGSICPHNFQLIIDAIGSSAVDCLLVVDIAPLIFTSFGGSRGPGVSKWDQVPMKWIPSIFFSLENCSTIP